MKAKAESEIRADLLRIYAEAIKAVLPQALLNAALDKQNPQSRQIREELDCAAQIRVLAVGKAALGMAQAAQDLLGDRVDTTLAIAPRSGDKRNVAFPVAWGSHPTPDAASEEAGRRALEFVTQTSRDELLLMLLSGGASALMALPAEGVPLADKAALAKALMGAGAAIGELNAVRKHLSQIKGGGLLRALKDDTRVLNLIISDVIGNDLSTIGSGPTVADSSTFSDAIAVLKRRKLWGRAPETIRNHLERGAAGEIEETVKPNDEIASRAINLIIGDNQTAQNAARKAAAALGYKVPSGPDLSREAETVGREYARLLSDIGEPRVCVVGGGESTVQLGGDGKGGRAQHCALAAALELGQADSQRPVVALCAGTDGIDGPTDAAGAIITSATLARAREARLNAAQMLKRADSYEFFRALGDLIVIGPTGANVCDLFVGIANY